MTQPERAAGSLAQAIRAEMVFQNCTAAELVQRSGVDRTVIEAYLAGRRQSEAGTIERMMSALYMWSCGLHGETRIKTPDIPIKKREPKPTQAKGKVARYLQGDSPARTATRDAQDRQKDHNAEGHEE